MRIFLEANFKFFIHPFFLSYMIGIDWNMHQPSLWLYDLISVSYSVFYVGNGYYLGESVVRSQPHTDWLLSDQCPLQYNKTFFSFYSFFFLFYYLCSISLGCHHHFIPFPAIPLIFFYLLIHKNKYISIFSSSSFEKEDRYLVMFSYLWFKWSFVKFEITK